jgi:hypothetical protein
MSNSQPGRTKFSQPGVRSLAARITQGSGMMNTNWRPIKFLIEVIALQVFMIGLAASLLASLF